MLEKAYTDAARRLLAHKNPAAGAEYWVPNPDQREMVNKFAQALKDLENDGFIVVYGGDIQNTKNWKAMPL